MGQAKRGFLLYEYYEQGELASGSSEAAFFNLNA